jgi:A/G-specific adenine glycosylase
MTQQIAEPLLAWYDAQKRDLPWRRTSDPYAIWISEIMLQQTRVAAVIGYYNRFLSSFPDVRALARATEEQVLAHWSGLGYYRRARMMHQAAKVILEQHASQFPRTAASLRTLPGIGRYTAAAIASIAFREPIGLVDGNVERVLSRLLGEGTAFANNQCWSMIADLVDATRPGDFNQAMMELGATVCTPKSPQCLLCPLKHFCRTLGEHEMQPAPSRRNAELQYLLKTRAETVLLTKRAPTERLMPSMWELPSPSVAHGEPAYRLKHSITNTDYQVLVFSSGPKPRKSTEWMPKSSLPTLPLTGLARKVLKKANILK